MRLIDISMLTSYLKALIKEGPLVDRIEIDLFLNSVPNIIYTKAQILFNITLDDQVRIFHRLAQVVECCILIHVANARKSETLLSGVGCDQGTARCYNREGFTVSS